MALLEAPDGISIGSGTLPIYKFDEWVQDLEVGELTAGEVKIITIDQTDLDPTPPTVDIGMTVLARPNNVYDDVHYNYGKLLIMGAWCVEAKKISVRVKNLEATTVDFGADQWTFTYLRTFEV